MRNTFPGYYRPTDEQFSKLWDTCLFAFDANVLKELCLDPQSERTKELLKILDIVADRLWVPHQAALEFQQVRLREVTKKQDGYDQAYNLISSTISTFGKYYKEWVKDPNLTEVKELLDQVRETLTESLEKIDKLRPEYADLLDQGEVGDRLADLFEGKTGHPYTWERLEAIYAEGRLRYEKEIPPGYGKDEAKEGDRPFGDLVLWFQLIDKAKEDGKPIIFVTNDQKPDWFQRRQQGRRKIIGPRPELINEMASKAEVSYYQYSGAGFLDKARTYLKIDISEETIEQARRDDERQLVPPPSTGSYYPSMYSGLSQAAAEWNRAFKLERLQSLDLVSQQLAKTADLAMQAFKASVVDQSKLAHWQKELSFSKSELAAIAKAKIDFGDARLFSRFPIAQELNLAAEASRRLGFTVSEERELTTAARADLDTPVKATNVLDTGEPDTPSDIEDSTEE